MKNELEYKKQSGVCVSPSTTQMASAVGEREQRKKRKTQLSVRETAEYLSKLEIFVVGFDLEVKK